MIAASIAAITALAAILLVAGDAPRAPAPRSGDPAERAVPSAGAERKAERPAIERRYEGRSALRYERKRAADRPQIRARRAGGEAERDRMRREAARRHADRMRAEQQLRLPAGSDCEVPDAFDVPGCASP